MSAPPLPHLPEADDAPVYGTCLRLGSFWVIECSGAAMTRLKRCFPRIQTVKLGTVRIKRTPEVDRDLQWFQDRFLLEMTDEDRAELAAGAEQHRRTARFVGRLVKGKETPRPFQLAIPPRDYQRVAAEMWLRVKRMILADDLGLGKTVSALTALSEAACRPAIIVCPTHLPRQWVGQIGMFLPDAVVHVLKGTTPYDLREAVAREARRARRAPPAGLPDFVILPYSRLSFWAQTLSTLGFRSIVYDEVQDLRHPDTQKASGAAVLTDAVELVLGMSATPTINYGAEVFNVMEAVSPGALGTREEFKTEWCNQGGEDRKRRILDPRGFGLHLRESGLLLRRTRADVRRELPKLSVCLHTIDANLDALNRVKGAATELAKIILDQRSGGKGAGLLQLKAAGEFDRLLRQATGVAKAPYAAEYLRMCIESGERVLAFAWHREVYAILMEMLKAYAPAMYTGSETEKQKSESLRRFIAGETPLLLMSWRSGSGVDGLQHVCRTVVGVELDWSPYVHGQGFGRVHRDGQPDPVMATMLVTEEGSDPTVSHVCGLKTANSEPIRNPDATTSEVQLDPHHVRRLAEEFMRRHGHR